MTHSPSSAQSVQLESNPLYDALKLAVGMLSLHGFEDDAKKVAAEARSAASAQATSPVDEVFDWLETEVTAISCRYHGDPSYDHDAYWMRDRVVKLIGEARQAFATPSSPDAREAAALIEQQAARIAEYERKERSTARLLCRHGDGKLCIDGAALESAAKAEPFGWVKPAGGNYFTRSELTARRIGGMVPVYLVAPAATDNGVGRDAEDVARYRWLRDFNVRCKDGVQVKPPCEHVFASIYSHEVGTIPATRLVTGEELDRAIDAALSQKAGEQG